MTGLRCRQITKADIDAVASLLTRGFPTHDRAFWQAGFAHLTRREPPPGLPKYGYLLEGNGAIVGAILLICTAVRSGETAGVRCNLSSWCVEPAFRAYAPLLVAHALRHKDVTYLNSSSAPHTRPIIEAQGFARYSDGVVVAMPMWQGLFSGAKVDVLDGRRQPPAVFDPADRDVLTEHAAHGCICFWCVIADRAYPFVFRPRLVRGFVPCAQLIYCSDVGDLARFAGPIGRVLARHGLPFLIIDANGRIPGLFGWFSRGSMPKYFRGPLRPRLGDLAYTEQALFGV